MQTKRFGTPKRWSWPSPPDVVDSWLVLAAIAQATGRIQLGPMLTPLARNDPWRLALQIVTLDRLSQGRAAVGVGLGSPHSDFRPFWRHDPEQFSSEDALERAEMSERGERYRLALKLLTAFLRGEVVTHHGKYWFYDGAVLPLEAWDGRVAPLYFGGARGPGRSRAYGAGGVVPLIGDEVEGFRPLTLQEVRGYTRALTDHGGFKPEFLYWDRLASSPRTPAEAQAASDAGVDVWIETVSPGGGDEDTTPKLLALVRDRVNQLPILL